METAHVLGDLSPKPRRLIEELAEIAGAERMVAFDADGTLWRGDVGEDLLRYLCAERLLPARSARGLYLEYERRVDAEPAEAYAFAVEVMNGMSETAVRELCRGFFSRRYSGRLFAFAKPLMQALHARGFVAWVVSASPFWIVAEGARLFGIPEERVLAVRSAVDAGQLTRRVERPIPCGDGKVSLLKARGLRPALAVGNGELDLPMLEYAERALVVAPYGDPGNALVMTALQRGWPIQRG